MNTFKHKNSLRTIEAEISKKVKKNEARPKFTGSYKKKRVCLCLKRKNTVFFGYHVLYVCILLRYQIGLKSVFL